MGRNENRKKEMVKEKQEQKEKSQLWAKDYNMKEK